MPNSETFARTVLARHAEVRETVLGSDEFRTWQRDLPSVVVDGRQYYIRGGDQLQDEDQLVVDWAHRTGLLSDTDVSAHDRDAEAMLPPGVVTVPIE